MVSRPLGKLERISLVLSSFLFLNMLPPARAENIRIPLDKNYSVYLEESYIGTHVIYYDGKNEKMLKLNARKGKDSLEIIFGTGDSQIPLNMGFTKYVLLRPKNVKVSLNEQNAWISGKKEPLNLVPLEETRLQKKIAEKVGDAIDMLTNWFVWNPLQDFKNWLLESAMTSEEAEYSGKAKELEKEVGGEYDSEKIEMFTRDSLGEEYQRRINLSFNLERQEGIAYMRALLKPAIGKDDCSRTEWININFLVRGKKLPSWVKKQELGAETVSAYEGLEQIMKKRTTRDIVAYDSQTRRTIIYSSEEKNIDDSEDSKIKGLNYISYITSISQDITIEGFSKEGVVLVEVGKEDIRAVSVEKFKDLSQETEKK